MGLIAVPHKTRLYIKPIVTDCIWLSRLSCDSMKLNAEPSNLASTWKHNTWAPCNDVSVIINFKFGTPGRTCTRTPEGITF